MHRRDFVKMAGLSAAAQALPLAHAQEAGSSTGTPATSSTEKPNIILIIADQRHYGLSKATGYPLDTSPSLDRLQSTGVGFKHNYCTTPACVPSRVSMLTGRWPEATHVRTNFLAKEALFSQDVYQVAKQQGYRTALSGKNHTYLTKNDVDVWREFSHENGYVAPDASPDVKAFEHWLSSLHFNMAMEPSPFPLETQIPFRIVSEAIKFIDETGDQPFLIQVSFPEPHDPEQIPKPYWNMFSPGIGPQPLCRSRSSAKDGPPCPLGISAAAGQLSCHRRSVAPLCLQLPRRAPHDR